MWKRNNQWMIDEFDRRGNMPEKDYQYFRVITKLAYTTGVFGGLAPFKWLFFTLRGLTKPTPRGPVGLAGRTGWGHKSTGSCVRSLYVAMRAHGFDTCPMEGFDAVRVKKLLGFLEQTLQW